MRCHPDVAALLGVDHASRTRAALLHHHHLLLLLLLLLQELMVLLPEISFNSNMNNPAYAPHNAPAHTGPTLHHRGGRHAALRASLDHGGGRQTALRASLPSLHGTLHTTPRHAAAGVDLRDDLV